MNSTFFAKHCLEYWQHKNGRRGARKVRGYTPVEGLYLKREDVGFSIEADGTHAFLKRNAEKLGYARIHASNFKNRYKKLH